MLRSNLCDYSDAYVWVKGKITVTNPNDNANFNKELTLKNNAPFISCISKINGELVENAEDLDIVTPMYNLLEYSKNYEKTSGSLDSSTHELSNDSNTDMLQLRKLLRNMSYAFPKTPHIDALMELRSPLEGTIYFQSLIPPR